MNEDSKAELRWNIKKKTRRNKLETKSFLMIIDSDEWNWNVYKRVYIFCNAHNFIIHFVAIACFFSFFELDIYREDLYRFIVFDEIGEIILKK